MPHQMWPNAHSQLFRHYSSSQSRQSPSRRGSSSFVVDPELRSIHLHPPHAPDFNVDVILRKSGLESVDLDRRAVNTAGLSIQQSIGHKRAPNQNLGFEARHLPLWQRRQGLAEVFELTEGLSAQEDRKTSPSPLWTRDHRGPDSDQRLGRVTAPGSSRAA